MDGVGNIYFGSANDMRVRKITPAGVVSTVAGSGLLGWIDGPGDSARFFSPLGVAADSSGNVYVADTANQRIRKIDPAGVVSTLAGQQAPGWADGLGSAAKFNNPQGVAVDSAGNVYVGDISNYQIRKITPAGLVSTLAGTGQSGWVDGPAAAAQFSLPWGVALDGAGNVYVSDNALVRKISPAGNVTTVAGTRPVGFLDGSALTAQFANPPGIAVSSQGDIIYVADAYNQRIRKIAASGKLPCGIAGSSSQLGGLYVSTEGNFAATGAPMPDNPPVDFNWTYFNSSFAIAASPAQQAGNVLRFFPAAVSARRAFEIDCQDLLERLGIVEGQFISGFAVIQSAGALDLVAVSEAAAGPAGAGITLGFERPLWKK